MALYVSKCNDTYVEMGAPEAIAMSLQNQNRNCSGQSVNLDLL